MALTISLAAPKGGAGKSTIAICLAAELHRRGYKVLLVDADPQGSAMAWAATADQAEVPRPAVTAIQNDVDKQLRDKADGFDVVIIDAPPHRAPVMRSIYLASHLVLVPVRPGATDMNAMRHAYDLLRMAKEVRPGVQSAFVVNMRDARTIFGRQIRQALEPFSAPTLEVMLSSLVAFAECVAAGQGVTSYAPKTKAAKQFEQLTDELLQMFAAKTNDDEAAA